MMTEEELDEMRMVLFTSNETTEEAVERVWKELFGDRRFDPKATKTIEHLIQMALI